MPSPSPSRKSAVTRGGVVIPHNPTWYQRAAAWLIFLLIRGSAATLRCRYRDVEGTFQNPPFGPAIFCVWHNRLALCLIVYERMVKRNDPSHRMAAMVSASKDGALLAHVLRLFKVTPARGSSSRRGAQALLELTRCAGEKYDLAITPDGPRGPKYVVQDGVISLAQITGLPIVPASYCLQWKLRMRSWDGFQVPLPFSRCDMVVGKPLRVPRESTAEERAALREQLQQALLSITQD